jgi:CRISPR-associated Csx14 family protein
MPTALVATLGTTPSVVTRVVDHLQAVSPLDRLVIVHTAAPPVLDARATLLDAFPPTIKVAYDKVPVRDLVDEPSNGAMLAALCRHVWKLRREGFDVIVAVAGGRKTQSAYGLLAAMLFGAVRAVHVIDGESTLIDVPFPSLSVAQLEGDPPDDDAELLRLVRASCDRIPALLALGRWEEAASATVRTKSPAMAKLLLQVRAALPLGVPLYLHGRPGSGKRRLAEAIHHQSGRAGAFRAAVAETVSAMQLFGYRDDPGLFEACHGGTLFLDDVDHLSKSMQSALLDPFGRLPRVRFRRENDPTAREADVLLICAGSQSLADLVSSGALVEEWPRRVMRIAHDLRIPSLAERAEDLADIVPELIEENAQRHGAPRPALPPALLDALKQFRWGSLEIDDLGRALLTWAVEAPGDWTRVTGALESLRPSPAWDEVEIEERGLLESWLRIRRNPELATSLKEARPWEFRRVAEYACAHFEHQKRRYPGLATVDDFCLKYFGLPRKEL